MAERASAPQASGTPVICFEAQVQRTGGSTILRLPDEASAKMPSRGAVSERDTVALKVEPTKDWPEPEIPEDFQTALADAPDILRVVEEHHADGALGMGPLDQCHQEPSNPRTTGRSRHLKTSIW
jgi:hypothetical protein